VRYAVNLPIIGEYSNPKALVELAKDAEAAGWDAVFVWDSMVFDPHWKPPVADPWIVLGAIASHTERVKIGTMVAQLARRRPWKVAREVVTLDHLSGGRMILGVGLGFSGEAEFAQFGEDGDARVRADKLDEALAIINGLCSGEPFSYERKYYALKETTFTPRPVQEHIPIWVAGYWPNKRPFRRAAQWDGAAPAEMDIRPDGFSILPSSPETVKDIKAYIDQHRTSSAPYDIIVSRVLPDEPEEEAAMVKAYEEAGVTWLLRDMLPWEVHLSQASTIVRSGPPAYKLVF
jgi:alkanesulfonate monooxygenase SsuD/methylene tetrahydromethanopterin reductase-like flavin-dependent oxidoreductase (luciferase family)